MTDNNQSESFFKWGIPGLFLFIFIFSIQLTIEIQYNLFLMTGFEPLPSGVRSNRSTNWATLTPGKGNWKGILHGIWLSKLHYSCSFLHFRWLLCIILFYDWYYDWYILFWLVHTGTLWLVHTGTLWLVHYDWYILVHMTGTYGWYIMTGTYYFRWLVHKISTTVYTLLYVNRLLHYYWNDYK